MISFMSVPINTAIYCDTKAKAEELCDFLGENGYCWEDTTQSIIYDTRYSENNNKTCYRLVGCYQVRVESIDDCLINSIPVVSSTLLDIERDAQNEVNVIETKRRNELKSHLKHTREHLKKMEQGLQLEMANIFGE